MRSRDAQFYLFDAFFAATILLLGVGFLVADYDASPLQAQTQTLLSDTTQTLTSQPLGELFTDYTNEHSHLLDEEFTAAQQIQVWWHNTSCEWCMPNATALTESLLKPIQDRNQGVIILLHNETTSTVLFNQSLDKEPELMIINHQVLITDTPEGDILGPDNLEVRVWQ